MNFILSKKVLYTAGTILIIIIAHVLGILRPVESLIIQIGQPIFGVTYETATESKGWLSAIRNADDLRSENGFLKLEIAQLKSKQTEIEVLRDENTALKEALDYKENSFFDPLLARLIGRIELAGDTVLLLNKGDSDGVEVSDLVVDEKGALVGEIMETSPHISHVRLLVNPQFKIAVKKNDDPAPIGVLRGDLSISSVIELIPADTELSVGDTIVTAQLDGTPENIRIGTIGSIEQEETLLFKSAAIVPESNLDNLVFVNIITKTDDN